MSNDVLKTDVVLSCSNIKRYYQQGPQELKVLDGINFTAHRGERVAIIGSSGSGKTTFLNMLGGLDTPTGGTVEISGTNIHALSHKQMAGFRNSSIGFVYQFHHLLPEFSAVENIALPMLIGGFSAKQAQERANKLLEQVGIAQRAAHRPSELSGGERQRVAIARALVMSPELVLMDEPTGNLDSKTAKDIAQLMVELNSSTRCCFVVITHDVAFAQTMDRRFKLDEGRLDQII
ncbi:MAG: ABC transporter ATP-binding protein [Pseudomonadales bacterium]|nr:ABC transporter ATP-binding protein [Pseudomonadales bacterium]